MNDTVDSAWISAGSQPVEEADFPLQYAAIFAECKPVNGNVSLESVGKILVRAQTPSEASAQLLKVAVDPSSGGVSEQRFFWVLAHAAALQSSGDTALPALAADGDLSVLPDRLSEVALQNTPTKHVFETELEYYPAQPYSIRVSLLQNRAGSYFSKHAVYSVEGVFQQTQDVKCIRRFRDFCNLHERLLQKYPFRAVPVLPPKRLSLNGTHLVEGSQTSFLNARAQALTRFLHLVTQHPILGADKLVYEFLMLQPADSLAEIETAGNPEVETDSILSKLIKLLPHAQPLALPDELSGIQASPLFISQWHDTGRWAGVERLTLAQFEHVQTIVIALVKQAALVDSLRFNGETISRSSFALARSLSMEYGNHAQQSDLAEIKRKIELFGAHTNAQSVVRLQQHQQLERHPLEQLRLYKDMLAAVLALFARHPSASANTIPEQRERIAKAQKRLESEVITDEERHSCRTEIQAAEEDIAAQTNREWLIRMVTEQELQMLQNSQYQLSRFLKSFGDAELGSAQETADLAAKFVDDIVTLPYGGRA